MLDSFLVRFYFLFLGLLKSILFLRAFVRNSLPSDIMEGGNIFEPINPPQQNHPQNPPLANQPLRPRTLGEYSRPSHQGYRNTIELTQGANVPPLRSDTIRLVQSGCAFHGLRSEDPNQHLKDFLKIIDSIDLDVATRETTRLRLF